MPISYSDRNTPPEIVRARANQSIGNGESTSWHIGWGIAGGFADSLHNPTFTATFPNNPGFDFDADLGVLSFDGSLSPDDVSLAITIGVENDLGPTVTESFVLTVGTPSVVVPPAPDALAPEGQLRIKEDSGDLVIDFAITPIAGSHTARQVQRRVWDSAAGPEANWSDVGSQATTDDSYTHSAPTNNEVYEYRVVDTVDSVDYPSKTIVGFVSSVAPTLVDGASDVTWTHGPFVVVVDKTAYGLTATLDGVTVISDMHYSCVVDRETTPATLSDPVPTTVTVGSDPNNPYHVDLHHEDAVQELQLWTDLEFFPNRPLIVGFPFVRSFHTDNPHNHYSSIYDTYVIRDEDFGFDSALIQDSPESWLQASIVDGRSTNDDNEVRVGVSTYGDLDGGRWLEGLGTSPRSLYIRGDDAKPDYIDYIFGSPVNVDSFVMDYQFPQNDTLYTGAKGQLDWEAFDSGDNSIGSGKTEDQNNTETGLSITGALSGVKRLRLDADQQPYGKRVAVGTLRGIVGGETIHQIEIGKLADSVAACYPLGFAVERLHRQSPCRVDVTATGVKRVARQDIPYFRDLIAGIPAAGSTIPVAIAVGTGGADQGFDQPTAHTGQSSKVPEVIFPYETGETAKTTEVWDNAEAEFYDSYEREAFVANNSSDGDTLLSAIQITSPEMHMFTSHRQAGTQNVAVNLLRRNWTRNNWDLSIAGTHFSMRAMCADYGPRSKYLGSISRKSETNVFNYFLSEPQLGYQHQAIALLLMYEYTGRKMYLDHARLTIDGGTYNLNRDTHETGDPGFYQHSWTRTQAMMLQCAILGYENFGDVHPTYDGDAPTNTNGSPENPIPSGRTYLSLIKDRMDSELDPIIAGQSTLKYYGAEQYKGSQPVWATWSMAMLCWYYNRMVTDGDTARAANALRVIQDTAKKYMDDFIQGTGSSTQFAYATAPGQDPTDPLVITSWAATYSSSGYVSFFMELLALGYEADFDANGTTTLNTDLKAKVLQLWNDFKGSFDDEYLNHRVAAGMLHGLPNCTRIFPGDLT